MYDSFDRELDFGDDLGMVHRSVTFHAGDLVKFLARHQRSVRLALERGDEGMAEIGPTLMSRLSDQRMLRAAWNDLASGGSGPGPNGLRFEYFSQNETWSLLRAIGQLIKMDRYKPGPDRRVAIPKGSGRGTRTLTIQNIEDRVVSRALLRVVEPLIEPTFDPLSFGFRPHCDRHRALATLLAIARRDKLWFWVTDDVANAFDAVPRSRLTQILAMRLPDDVVRFIELISDTGGRRGLRQGSPHSPFLMNAYLDHFLDKPWRRRFPRYPLLRTADDLLVMCPAASEAAAAHEALRQMLVAAGMPLKSDRSAGVHDMAGGQAADWLGFRLQRDQNRLAIGIADRAWDRLAERLALAHDKPLAPLRAIEAVQGWIGQMGSSWSWESKSGVFGRIRQIAASQGFEELPSSSSLRARWYRAHVQWLKLSKFVHDRLCEPRRQ